MTQHVSLSIIALASGLILGVSGSRVVAADPQTTETQPIQSAFPLGEPLTLTKCLTTALTNNPSVWEARSGVEAAGKGVQSAEGKHYPRLSLDATGVARQDPSPYIPAQSSTVGPHFSDSYALWGPVLTMPLYQGGQISRNVELAKLRQRIQEDTLSLTRNDLIANTVNTYNKILQIRKLREASGASVKALEEQRKNVQQLYDVKRAARVDLLKVEVQLANEKQRLLTLSESMATLSAVLRSLMGESVEGSTMPLVLADSLSQVPDTLGSFEDGLRTARQQRPEYLIAVKVVEEARLTMKNASSKLQPSINVFAAYTDQAGFNPSYDEAGWSVGVSASLPLFEKSLYSDVAKERVLHRKAGEHLQVVENQVRVEIQIALSSLVDSKARITTAERAVEQAAESFRIEQQRYTTGAGAMADMLLAQAADVTAAANYAQALFDYNAAWVAYRRATGTMEEYLK